MKHCGKRRNSLIVVIEKGDETWIHVEHAGAIGMVPGTLDNQPHTPYIVVLVFFGYIVYPIYPAPWGVKRVPS